MFWNRFFELCASVKLKPNRVASIIGVSSASVTKWKNGTIPNSDTLLKIADYFAVSVDYLLGKTDDRFYCDEHMLDILNEQDDDTLQKSPHNLLEMQRMKREKDEQAQKKQPTEKQAAAINKIKNMSPDELQQAEVFLDFIISKREDPVDE
ncbi:MAG: helix-turn-helix transcriptional regulator [Oscillospiraceae bacterium]|nr:helix-turn-helix transcriptional regulator [Oscillospiraceae bacterium]